MPKKRLTDKQIALVLRQAEADITVREICRRMGTTATFFCWKTYGKPMPSEIGRLKQLRDESEPSRRHRSERRWLMPKNPNHIWSAVFVHDRLSYG